MGSFPSPPADNTGRVIFWQDGQLLFDGANLSTRYGNRDCRLSLNSYSDSITPGPASYYVDDVSISPSRLNHIGLAAPTDFENLPITNPHFLSYPAV